MSEEETEDCTIVDDVLINWKAMDGDCWRTRQVNAMLTAVFTTRRGVPADECVSEARVIQGLEHVVALGDWGKKTHKFLLGRFARGIASSTGEIVNFPEWVPACRDASAMALTILDSDEPVDLVHLLAN